tara:strand:+ start:186 stop:413 length:228 start_codon:yes stop_codon:yes gene_type:complete
MPKKTIKQFKKRVNYIINKNTIDRFKIVADKDTRKISNIVENLIKRYGENNLVRFYLLYVYQCHHKGINELHEYL